MAAHASSGGLLIQVLQRLEQIRRGFRIRLPLGWFWPSPLRLCWRSADHLHSLRLPDAAELGHFVWPTNTFHHPEKLLDDDGDDDDLLLA
jgi:hypothetical protein